LRELFIILRHESNANNKTFLIELIKKSAKKAEYKENEEDPIVENLLEMATNIHETSTAI
jgi:hypothetical protein